MEAYTIFKDLAIIIIAAKFFGIVARKCKAPQVVGEIIAGLIIGPCIFGWVVQTDFLTEMAEIGVILLMFSAGLLWCICSTHLWCGFVYGVLRCVTMGE